jgi:hypothetical protein
MSHWDKTTPWGSPRFYPPGQHPAAAEWRDGLKRAESFKAEHGPTRDLDEYIAYVQQKLMEFEQGESDAKAMEA